MSTSRTQQSESRPGPSDQEIAALILEKIRGLQFGSVEITVQDGRVVQVERREKFRPAAQR